MLYKHKEHVEFGEYDACMRIGADVRSRVDVHTVHVVCAKANICAGIK